MRAPHESGRLQPYSPFLGHLSGEGKSCQWTELQVVPLVVPLAWKQKWPEIRVNTASWAVANGLTGWSGPWKEYDEKTGKEEGRGMCLKT